MNCKIYLGSNLVDFSEWPEVNLSSKAKELIIRDVEDQLRLNYDSPIWDRMEITY